MKTTSLDLQAYARTARQAAAEGTVLLKNDNQTLPLQKGEIVAVFGTAQLHYYKSGTGSGGMVNTRYTISILDALKTSEWLTIHQPTLNIYETWIQANPFLRSAGWAQDPWSQPEMPLDDGLAKQAKADCDAAVVIIGRTAGEDRDNTPEGGSWFLTDTEEQMIKTVCAHFKRTVVLLNTGNIIDMQWVARCQPGAVLYVWQGGQEGGLAVLDVLTGAINPSGRLTDTIAKSLKDYPSDANYGFESDNIYAEDVYVGYRYFETVAEDRVLYPFGFGLSYTDFHIMAQLTGQAGTYTTSKNEKIKTKASEPIQLTDLNQPLQIKADVKNIGSVAGRQVVQIYAEAPQGRLAKPRLVLVGFAKTEKLQPGQSQTLDITIPLDRLASYDDSGKTGNPFCFILEAGQYQLYAGENIRILAPAGICTMKETTVLTRHRQAMAPEKAFERMTCVKLGNAYHLAQEAAPLRQYDPEARALAERPAERRYTGDQGYKLQDVLSGQITMDAFLDQLDDETLACLAYGEGMSSPKVTPGTAAAFGGLTPTLQSFGIPLACCSDGPSGLRMDSGILAFSLPNGTCLACTFDEALNTELFSYLGQEMQLRQIDFLLGPGMNIHRHPLNGRNFEYFSEDPLVTGLMAAAQLKGLKRWRVDGTVKHFAANNQEQYRHTANAVVSERAMREIYLKGFEIAVKQGHVNSLMSTYGAINGYWTAGYYDLLTTILRQDWGFDGLVMTDWWAQINWAGKAPARDNQAAMVHGQNDVYMVVPDCKEAVHRHNLLSSLESGKINRGELLRGAANVCRVLMRLQPMQRLLNSQKTAAANQSNSTFENAGTENQTQSDRQNAIFGSTNNANNQKAQTTDADLTKQYTSLTWTPVPSGSLALDITQLDTERGAYNLFGMLAQPGSSYRLHLSCYAQENARAQYPITLFVNEKIVDMQTANGSSEEPARVELGPWQADTEKQVLRLFFAQTGLIVSELIVEKVD